MRRHFIQILGVGVMLFCSASTGAAMFEASVDGGPCAPRFMQKLLPTDPQPTALFGSSIALDGDNLIIGAPADNNDGVAYFFFRDESGNWVETDARRSGGHMGTAVAVEGETAVVGQP